MLGRQVSYYVEPFSRFQVPSTSLTGRKQAHSSKIPDAVHWTIWSTRNHGFLISHSTLTGQALHPILLHVPSSLLQVRAPNQGSPRSKHFRFGHREPCHRNPLATRMKHRFWLSPTVARESERYSAPQTRPSPPSRVRLTAWVPCRRSSWSSSSCYYYDNCSLVSSQVLGPG